MRDNSRRRMDLCSYGEKKNINRNYIIYTKYTYIPYHIFYYEYHFVIVVPITD
jgi:hypothetical protein